MSDLPRIKTPWYQYWNRFRLRWLPLLFLGVTAVFTVWLWRRQALEGQFLGEVYGVVLTVPAGADGFLLAAPKDPDFWQPYDKVARGQEIARLDDRTIRASIETLNATRNQLDDQVKEAQAQFQLELVRLEQNHAQEANRLLFEHNQLILETLRLKTLIQTDQLQLAYVEKQLDYMQKVAGDVDVFTTNVAALTHQQQVLKQNIDNNQSLYDTTEKQLKDVEQLWRKYDKTPPEAPTAQEAIAPLENQVAVYEAQLNELQIQLQNLTIYSPIDGVITQIYCQPGQFVRAGDPIITIAGEGTMFVVSHVPESRPFELQPGDPVAIKKANHRGARAFDSTIATVGPQVEPIPPHQLRDPTAVEFGRPIMIPIPPEMAKTYPLFPRELIEVSVRAKPLRD